MQVKRFVAENMRLALKMVKEELGPDAIILSNKRVSGGVELLTSVETVANDPATEPAANPFRQEQVPVAGASKLEQGLDLMQQEAQQRAEALAAALAKQNNEQKAALYLETQLVQNSLAQAQLEPDVVEFSSQPEQPSNAVDSGPTERLDIQPGPEEHPTVPNSHEEQGCSPLAATQQPPTMPLQPVEALPSVAATVPTGELVQMREDLQSMRDLLEQQLSTISWGSFSQQNPQKAGLWRRMKRMGISALIAEQLLQGIEESADGKGDTSTNNWQQLMKGLAKQLPVINDDLLSSEGVFTFVGPTGAGKTTTIGKLAARHVLKHGPDDIALVTTDTVRIAAHEQLRTFGRILNIPVKIVDKHNTLERVLFSLRHKSLVLVDTGGLNRQDRRLQRQLKELNELGNRVRSVLVIPTTSQAEVLRAAYHTYKTDNLMSCILTKLDETTSLGEAISLVVEKQLPVAYSTDGQAVPDDISIADSHHLIRSAIYLAKYIKTDEDTMAGEIVSLAKG